MDSCYEFTTCYECIQIYQVLNYAFLNAAGGPTSFISTGKVQRFMPQEGRGVTAHSKKVRQHLVQGLLELIMK
jgi:hypothetical protein